MKKMVSPLRRPGLTLCFLLWVLVMRAQLYPDYYGNGHQTGMKVTSSDDRASSMPSETLTGTGILPDEIGASRFLSQATLGYNYDNIKSVERTGIEAWLDKQIKMEYVPFEKAYRDNRKFAREILNNGYDHGELNTFTFYTKVFTEPDKLRQKMASALLQIMVISMQVPQIEEDGLAASTYYDIFYKNAFGNYRDILEQVTLHPLMGIYLSHFQNAQADYAQNTFPDENYAREIMQLFSIGLVQLKPDGTPRLDEEGREIPTYDNDDIREMAKVFTGLAGSERSGGGSADFEDETDEINLAAPMKLFPVEHDLTEKQIINDITLPAGRSGYADLQETLDILFRHPNVGPFLSTRLIQQFVKSNPTPAYVQRVATVFNDNGAGVRGDMGAVIKAILMDPEARDCDWIDRPDSGKLLQPYERFTKLFSAFELRTPSGKFFLRDQEYSGRLGQSFFNAPSVFNFFTPFFAEEKVIKPAGLVSPEFEIFNSITSVLYFNIVEDGLKDVPFKNKTKRDKDGNLVTNYPDRPRYNFSDEVRILNNEGIAALLNRLNILLCRGQLSYEANAVIQNALQQYRTKVPNYTAEDLVRDAVYFIVVSPDFIIQN